MKCKKMQFNNRLTLALWAALGLCLLCAAAAKFYAVWQLDAPKELREATTAYFAAEFAAGRNPYALATLDTAIPSPTNLYGFVTPLLLAPFVRLFGGLPPLQVCETVLLVVELAGLGFFYAAVYGQTKRHDLAMFGTFLVYGCYFRFAAVGGAFPDSPGLALTLALLWLVQRDETAGQYHPFGYAALIVLLFYVKQYFVFCAVGLAVYLFLHSRRDCAKLIGGGIALGLISLPVVNFALPLYFSCSLAVAQSSTATGDWSYSLRQIFSIGGKRYAVVCLALAAVFAAAVWQLLKKRKMELRAIAEGWKLSYPVCCAVFCLPLVVYIAQNKGTEYTYYLQLWFPYLIAVACAAFNLLPKCKYTACLTATAFMLAAVQVRPYVTACLLTENEIQAWQESLALVDEYTQKGEVLLAAEFSNHCLEKGIPTAEYGQAEYNEEINYLQYQASPIWGRLFPQAARIFKNNAEYYVQIRQKLKNHEYALVAVNANGLGSYQLTAQELESCGYTPVYENTLITGGWMWDVLYYSSE